MAGVWKPKRKVICQACGWKGKRAITWKPCPRCDEWKVVKVEKND